MARRLCTAAAMHAGLSKAKAKKSFHENIFEKDDYGVAKSGWTTVPKLYNQLPEGMEPFGVQLLLGKLKRSLTGSKCGIRDND